MTNKKKIILILIFSLVSVLFVLANLAVFIDSNDSGKVSVSSLSSVMKNEEVSNSLTMNSFAVLDAAQGVQEKSLPEAKAVEVGEKSVGAKDVQPKDIFDGQCKPSSQETNEGPGGIYCDHEDDEECFDYFTKSTVYACNKVLWCDSDDYDSGYFDKGTDYCIDSDTLNEAFLNCNSMTWLRDYLDWQQKNCNDYDGKSDWIYYCTDTEVLKRKWYSDYGCSDGACELFNGYWTDGTLVSEEGDVGYCGKRKEGVDKGWSGCSLCTESDYDCNWDTDCSGTLQCKGPWPCSLMECGCCSADKSWDSDLKKCCECSEGDGPCCDGCNYRSDSTICNSHISGTDQYKCTDNCLSSAIYARYQSQHCSGESSSCSGTKYWNSYNYQYCGSDGFCKGSTSWGTTIPTCKTARCTSGECCDASCGVYNFRPTSYVCINDLTWYGCPDGNSLGSDVKSKVGDRYCDGYTQACNGKFIWGSWSLKQDCSSIEYCEGVEGPTEFWCSKIACSSESDCGEDYWYNLKCQNNDVWGNFVDFSCLYPQTKNSKCSSSNTFKLKENCPNGCANGACIGCSCGSWKDGACGVGGCSSTQRQQTRTCIPSGCSAQSRCVADASCTGCTDECTSGQTKCLNSSIKQTCGNYDTDSCLEWPSSTTGAGNENCIHGCSNGACKAAPVNCSSNSECGTDGDSSPYCKNGNVWKNHTAYTCNNKGTPSSYCTHATTETQTQTCQYGCTNGACNPAPATPKPDLTVTDLVVQSMTSNTITLAFTVKNIGDAIANEVYWGIDDGIEINPKRTTAISLESGKKTRAYLSYSYSTEPDFLKAIVDFDNLVDESNESNNEAIIS